jgi:putative endonuclease
MLFGTNSRDTGNQAEQLARRFLQARGLSHLESNFLCKLGEIDLIMQDAESLVFVEVRFRQDSRFGSPAESIHAGKQKKLLRTARYYLQTHPKLAKLPCRFDVVSIDGSRPDQIDWIKNAIQAQD